MASATDEELVLRLRDDPATLVWTPELNERIRGDFNGVDVRQLAFSLGLTRSAVLYRARELGLRTRAQTWPLAEAAYWLVLDIEYLRDRVEVTTSGDVQAADLLELLPSIPPDERERVDPFFALELTSELP